MKVIEAKIVVLGSQGVGKTSLVVRYIGKMFSKHISPTIGASFFTCNINLDGARVKLQVWDTAGQERFRSMAPMYYRNANAALLVYDISSRSSFLALKGWVEELKSKVSEPLVLSLVGNKCDLTRAVPREEAARFADHIGADLHETSALTPSRGNVDRVFHDTAARLLQQAQNAPVGTNDGTHTHHGNGAVQEIVELFDRDPHDIRTQTPPHAIPARAVCC